MMLRRWSQGLKIFGATIRLMRRSGRRTRKGTIEDTGAKSPVRQVLMEEVRDDQAAVLFLVLQQAPQPAQYGRI